jgi:phage tail sheath gpL-like
MTAPFNTVPANTLVPFFWVEVNSGGTPFAGSSQLLLLGQKTSAGAAAAGVPYGPIASVADAVAQFGQGSMLVMMYVSPVPTRRRSRSSRCRSPILPAPRRPARSSSPRRA